MDWLDIKWWIRDTITDPFCQVMEDAGNHVFSAVDRKLDDVHKAGDKVIDAVCNPVDTVSEAVEWVKENPGKAAAAVATAGITVTAWAASNANPTGEASLGAIEYGNDKIGGGHDHRYNKGPDRTPAQKAGDAAKKKD